LNILHLSAHGSHSFVGKPSPNLISYPVKNSSTFKISAFLLLFWPKISTGVSKKKKKTVLLQQRQVFSRELNKIEN